MKSGKLHPDEMVTSLSSYCSIAVGTPWPSQPIKKGSLLGSVHNIIMGGGGARIGATAEGSHLTGKFKAKQERLGLARAFGT